MRLLIAEDDAASRTILTTILKNQGHEVVATGNGMEAWMAMSEPGAPKLAVLDWMMPEMNGIDVCRHIRGLDTDQPPYIIMLTSMGDKADIVTGLESGANDYLTKPYDRGELRARIEVGRRMVEMQARLAERSQELKESEEKYRSVFAAERDALLLVDRETGALLDVNDAACRLYGYSRDEMLGLKNADISAEPEETERAIEECRERIELRFHRKKDGTVFPVDISASFFTLNDHRVILGAVRDITDRRRAEEALQEAHDKLELRVRERTVELEKSKEELEIKGRTLEETNTALKVLLHQIGEDKRETETRFVSNVKALVLPYVEQVRKGHLDPRQKSSIGIIEANLNQIVSTFIQSTGQFGLTPREIQVAGLIRDGKSSKEIGEVMGVGPAAVDTYRNRIRHKLGLNNKKINLQSHLQSMK